MPFFWVTCSKTRLLTIPTFPFSRFPQYEKKRKREQKPNSQQIFLAGPKYVRLQARFYMYSNMRSLLAVILVMNALSVHYKKSYTKKKLPVVTLANIQWYFTISNPWHDPTSRQCMWDTRLLETRFLLFPPLYLLFAPLRCMHAEKRGGGKRGENQHVFKFWWYTKTKYFTHKNLQFFSVHNKISYFFSSNPTLWACPPSFLAAILISFSFSSFCLLVICSPLCTNLRWAFPPPPFSPQVPSLLSNLRGEYRVGNYIVFYIEDVTTA